MMPACDRQELFRRGFLGYFIWICLFLVVSSNSIILLVMVNVRCNLN